MNLSRLVIVLAVASGLPCLAGPSLPPDCVITGSADQSGPALVALPGEGMVTARLKGPLPSARSALRLRSKTGKEKLGVTVTLKDGAGETVSLAIRAADKTPGKEDAYLALGWKGWGRFYFRPNPAFYKPDEFARRKAEWEKLPGASESVFDLEFRPGEGTDVEVWMEGQFMQLFHPSSPLVEYEIALAPGASVEALSFAEAEPSPARALPVAAWKRGEGSGLANARLELKAGAELPASFRHLAGEAAGIAVGGLGTFTGLASDDLQSFFWRRHASHRLPEQRMFSVPLAVYSHAAILCAADEEGGKAREFTLRVTRYGGSRGNAMADTIVRVPADEAAETPEARRVGTVQAGPEGARRSVPLWLLKVPIKNGLIDDVLHDDTFRDSNVGTSRYLDVELLDPLPNVEAADVFPPPLGPVRRAWRPSPANYQGGDFFNAMPPACESGVTVYGIELERSPAEMTVRSRSGIQAFYASEAPEFAATVKALEDGPYTVRWEVADLSGKRVESGARTLALKAGAEGVVGIPVRQGAGWYAARFQLADSRKAEQLDYRTSFVVLPPDTRKAGLESPYYGQWFQKNQRSDIKLDEVGPLLQRLGIRRVNLSKDMPESESLKYGFTEGVIGWGAGRMPMLDFRDGKKTLEEAIATQEASLREQLALWPSADRMLVFHESGGKGAPFPTELWGEPARDFRAPEDENSPEALLRKEGGGQPASAGDAEEWRKNWPKRLEYLPAMARMVREKFPKIKMQYGNDGNSLALMGELFRQKFPRQWIDSINIEDLGQTFAPERGTTGGLQSAWFLRELARKTGYGDLPVSACTEWIGRMTERLGLQKQAEWKVRDALLALAYGFDTISIAGINDASSGYYYSIWGNGGLCTRYPRLAPKPSYAAVATLTQVLDQARFERFVPTGSTVVYVQEFRRGGEWVYAIWTPRGERPLSLKFEAAGPRRLTDLYGRAGAWSSSSLKASPSPQYLTSANRLLAVQAGVPLFPGDPAPEKPLQTVPLERLADVRVVSDPGLEAGSRKRPGVLPHRRDGQFEIREVEDPEMGKCLEIELKPGIEPRWPLEHDVVNLRLNVPVATRAKNAGIWIKGNGSWGEVDIQKSRPWGPWATNANLALRWPGDATLNFDGWNFIRYPYYDWTREPETQVQGVVITLPRKTLYGTEMAPVENRTIRIKSILLF